MLAEERLARIVEVVEREGTASGNFGVNYPARFG